MDAYYVTDVPDDGDIPTGTLCAPSKVCMNSSCTDYSVLNYDCKPEEMCNGKGVCNNLKHCHCDYGYAPPDCRSPGNGGSVDSGPPGKTTEENESAGGSGIPAKRDDEVPQVNILIFVFPSILLLFLVILIFFISLNAGIESVEPPGGSSEEGSEEAIAKSETLLPTESQMESAVTEGIPPEGAPSMEGAISVEGAPSVEEAPSLERATLLEYAPSSVGIPSTTEIPSPENAPAEPAS